MTINPILKAALENAEKWQKEEAEREARGETEEPEVEETDDSSSANDEIDEAWNRALEGPHQEAPDEDEAEDDDAWDAAMSASVEAGATEDFIREHELHTPDNTSATTQTPRQLIQIKGLDEKAVLVQLKRSMFGTSKRDEAETAAYGAGNVVKHLFEDKTCRMAAVKSAYSEVYTFVNDNTVPWGKGVRMLNINHYMTFTGELRKRIDHANAKVADLVANWDAEVQKDLDRLAKIEQSKGKAPGSLANPNNYPHASEIGDKFGIDVRYMPVPTSEDFRVTISDEDKASLQKQLEEAETNAARHVLEEMLEPMQRAVEKLNVPIGQDGSIFRDSMIDNMVNVADRMDKINVSDDPVVTEKIADLRSLVATYADNKDVLRNSQSVRRKAASQIDDLVQQMGGLV